MTITTSWGAPMALTPTGALISCQRAAAAPGTSAKMPTVMSNETPLPMPRAVICSPNHISTMVPAVRKIMEVRRKVVCPATTMLP